MLSACANFIRSQPTGDGVDMGVLAGLSFAGFDDTEVLARLREFAFAFPREYAARQKKTRWAEKTAFDSFSIPEIDTLCGNDAYFVGIVRHGLDVAVSCLDFVNAAGTYPRVMHTYIRNCEIPYSRHEGRPVQVLTPRMEARILSWTQKKPTDGSTHWSTRRLAKKLGIHHMMVARTWKKHRLQPHRLEHYKASNDPDFEKKAADVIGLYMNPPQHAAVFCIDEKTAIQALDRRDPILPLSPGRAERHGFEYVPAWDAFSLRRLRHEDGGGFGQDCSPPYQPGVCRLLGAAGCKPQAKARNTCHPR